MAASSLLVAGQALFASVELTQGVDCELFLKPYLGQELKSVCANIVTRAGLLSQTELDLVNRPLDETFAEISEKLKEGERVAVAAPASYGVLFTKGDRPEEIVQGHVQEVLGRIGHNPDEEEIRAHLSELNDVMRASFVVREGALTLIASEQEIQEGEKIWCKVPEGVVSTVFHSEKEVLIAIKRAGLFCDEIKRPCFFGKVKYDMWRTFQHECGVTLGEGYINHHPFTIYYVTRPA